MDSLKPPVKYISKVRKPSIARQPEVLYWNENQPDNDLFKQSSSSSSMQCDELDTVTEKAKQDTPPFIGSNLPLCADLLWKEYPKSNNSEKSNTPESPPPFVNANVSLCADPLWKDFSNANDDDKKTSNTSTASSPRATQSSQGSLNWRSNQSPVLLSVEAYSTGLPWDYANVTTHRYPLGGDKLKSFWVNYTAAYTEMNELAEKARELALDNINQNEDDEPKASYWKIIAPSGSSSPLLAYEHSASSAVVSLKRHAELKHESLDTKMFALEEKMLKEEEVLREKKELKEEEEPNKGREFKKEELYKEEEPKEEKCQMILNQVNSQEIVVDYAIENEDNTEVDIKDDQVNHEFSIKDDQQVLETEAAREEDRKNTTNSGPESDQQENETNADTEFTRQKYEIQEIKQEEPESIMLDVHEQKMDIAYEEDVKMEQNTPESQPINQLHASQQTPEINLKLADMVQFTYPKPKLSDFVEGTEESKVITDLIKPHKSIVIRQRLARRY